MDYLLSVVAKIGSNAQLGNHFIHLTVFDSDMGKKGNTENVNI